MKPLKQYRSNVLIFDDISNEIFYDFKDVTISNQSRNADQDMDNDELEDNNKWKTLDIAIFIVKVHLVYFDYK